MTRPTASAAARPNAQADQREAETPPTIMRKTSAERAPSAMRMPISRLRSADDIAHHTEDARRGERERDAPRTAPVMPYKTAGAQSSASASGRETSTPKRRGSDRSVDRGTDRRRHGQWVSCRGRRCRLLVPAAVRRARRAVARPPAGVPLQDVGDHAHHLPHPAQRDPPSDRILVREPVVYGRLVDDGDCGRVGAIAIRKATPAAARHPDRFRKYAVVNARHADLWIDIGWRWGRALDSERESRTRAAQRQQRRCGDGCDAWQPAEIPPPPPSTTLRTRCRSYPRPNSATRKAIACRRLTRLDSRQCAAAAQQEARAGEEHDGQRDLGHDEAARTRCAWRSAPPPRPAARPPASRPVACSAGNAPNARLASESGREVNSTTGRSSPISSRRGMSVGCAATSACVPAYASARPITPPIRASTTASVRSWRNNRPRPAPSAARTVSSSCRPTRVPASGSRRWHMRRGTRTDGAQQHEQRRANFADDELPCGDGVHCQPWLVCGYAACSAVPIRRRSPSIRSPLMRISPWRARRESSSGAGRRPSQA